MLILQEKLHFPIKNSDTNIKILIILIMYCHLNMGNEFILLTRVSGKEFSNSVSMATAHL